VALQDRLASLITAVGTDVKQLKGSAFGQRYGASVANQTIGASDTYLTGSTITIPDNSLQVGSIYKLRFNVTKTGAGAAAPIVNVRIGTAGAIADTSQGVLTFAAQTAVADEGYIEVGCVFRTVGAAAVLQSLGNLSHRLAATGLSTSGSSTVTATSASFASTTSGLKIGASVNPGTSASWTVNLVEAELINLQQIGPAGILFVNALSEVPVGTPANTLVVLKGA
jgi:hypothetical protein